MEMLGASIVLLFLAIVVKSEPSAQQVRSAIERAKDINAMKSTLDQLDEGNGGSPKTSRCPMMANFHGRRSRSDKIQDRRANEMLTAAKILLNEGYTLEDLQHEVVKAEFSRQSDGSCPLSGIIECDESAPYRTVDGSCNNLKEPRWGKADVTQRRVLEPAYDDGIGSARATSVSSDGGQLPNPRTISNMVHKNTGTEIKSASMTLHTFQMGQFLGYEMIGTPTQSEVEDCCTSGADTQNCLNIMIEGRNDTFEPIFHENYCMEFSRSAPAFCPDAFFNGQCRRQQINAVTSYIDTSNVYGSSQKQIDQLREAGTGFMKTQDGVRLPNNPDQTTCKANNTIGEFCSLAGNHRVNVVPSLTAYHYVFVVEHNRIAKLLQPYYPDPATLFQETRKIIIAIMQKIVYDEFLPSVLSPQALAKYRLLSSSSYAYDSSIDATIANSFGIAYRMGHTWIPSNMSLFGSNLQLINKQFETDDTYNNPFLTYVDGNPNSLFLDRRNNVSSGDSSINATIANSFGIAHRIGHSWIPSNMSLHGRTTQSTNMSLNTRSTYNDPSLTNVNGNSSGLEGLAYWLSGQTAPETDRFIEEQARSHLFLDRSKIVSFDIVALNIKRGRDHGLSSYTEYRKHCGLSTVTAWSDLKDHDQVTIRRLQGAGYQTPEDVDLFTGALTENAVQGGTVGPTLECILGDQFMRLKFGDRFWYEGNDAGFTAGEFVVCCY